MSFEGEKIPEKLILTFDGKLAPNHTISARTLSHSLGHLQRAIDKIVYFEQYDKLHKYSQLSSKEYYLADLVVGEFEEGSLVIPLVNEHIEKLGAKITDILDAPYKKASQGQYQALAPIAEQVPAARNRVIHGIAAGLDEQNLIADAARGQGWFRTAVLQDFNHLISPLRSKAANDDDMIQIGVTKGAAKKVYAFDSDTSYSFNSIVTEKRLGPETKFTGILEGLERRKVGKFPFSGTFTSIVTGLEMRLLVPNEKAALALNPFNLRKKQFSIWAAPLLVYKAFDEGRGDIIFLDFV